MIPIFIFLVINISILVIFQIILRKEGYLHPIRFVFLYCFLFIFVSVVAIRIYNFRFNWSSLIPIYTIILSFSIGGIIVKANLNEIQWKNEPRKNLTLIKIFNNPLYLYFILLFSIFGYIGMNIHLKANGLSNIELLTLNKFANKMSVLRYSEKLYTPLLVNILYSFNFAATILSGAFYALHKVKLRNLIGISPVIVGFLMSISTGSRAGFMMLMVIWISSFISLSIMVNNGRFFSFRKILIRILIMLSLFVFYFILVQFYRGGGVDKFSINTYSETISVYFFGYLSAFSEWWTGYTSSEFGYGRYNFAGIFDIFFANRNAGIFSDAVYITDKHITNVYTAFRGVIQDYGFLGATIIAFLHGGLSTYLYVKLISGKRHSAFIFMCIFYSTLLWSITTSILNYNTIILSFFIAYFALKILKYRYSLFKLSNFKKRNT